MEQFTTVLLWRHFVVIYCVEALIYKCMGESVEDLFSLERNNFELPFSRFESFTSSTNCIVDSLSHNLHKPVYIDKASEMDIALLQPFLETMGYDLSHTQVRLLSNDLFFVITTFDSGMNVGELYKYFDVNDQLLSLNTVRNLSIEGLVVGSDKIGYLLQKPFVEQGYFSKISEQERHVPLFSQTPGMINPEFIQFNSIGAIQNPNSNQWAALEFFHELKHLYQEDRSKIDVEVEASQFALFSLDMLRKNGLDLCPRHSFEECKQYFKKSLQTYLTEPPKTPQTIASKYLNELVKTLQKRGGKR